MDKQKQSILEYIKTREEVKIQPEDVDYSIAEKYIPYFKMIDSLKSSIIVVSDFYKNNYYYTSERFNTLFGFTENKLPDTNQIWFRKKFHPEDYILNIAGVEYHKYVRKLPIKERKNIMLVHDFRIRNENNNWIRVIVQDYCLELDKKGNIWLNIKYCDFSPIQDLEKPGTVICRNISTGKIIFSMEGEKEEIKKISSREKEVLSLIASGKRSKEIAEALFISVNTVNNHRKNLIEKLNASNSSEAIKIAHKLKIL